MNSKKPPVQASVPVQDAGKDSPQQIGEGSYEGTRNYRKSIDTYLEEADVAADAKAAKPADAAQAEELRRAEEKGRAHSKSGAGKTP
jgi:hypothetical protein